MGKLSVLGNGDCQNGQICFFHSKSSTGIKHQDIPTQTANQVFVGREQALTYLDQHWLGGKTNLLILHAERGTGKTALLHHWLMQSDALHFPPRRTYVWTFQEGDNSDVFFSEALAHFGYNGKVLRSPWEKGLTLAALLREHAALLLLDNIAFKDPKISPNNMLCEDAALHILLQQLHEKNPGLCIVSSRDSSLKIHTDKHLAAHHLAPLAHHEAAFLVRKQFNKSVYEYSTADINQLLDRFAKNLNILKLITTFFVNYDVNNDSELKENIFNFNIENNDQAAIEIIKIYEDHLLSAIEKKLLYLFSSFKHTAHRQAVAQLLNAPREKKASLVGLFKRKQSLAYFLSDLKALDYKAWRRALSRLAALNLIVWDKEQAADEIVLHPSVHRYYAACFQQKYPRIWQHIHRDLYQYYRDATTEDRPKSLRALQPLFTALAHAVQANLEAQAHKEVYWERIRQRVDKHLNQRLGAPASDLQLLGHFFTQTWCKTKPSFSYDQQCLLLGWALSDLLALGKLQDAITVLRTDLEGSLSLEDWQGAGLTSGKLTEVYLSLGRIKEAAEVAYQSIDFAERSHDQFLQIIFYAALGKALHYANRLTDSERMFRKAERLQKEWTSENAWLPSVQNYMYCELLLQKGDYTAVLQRVSATIKASKQQHWSTGVVLDQLLLGRAYLLKARIMHEGDYTEALEWLALAINGLHHNGQWQYLPIAWLSRAKVRRYQGQLKAALSDLALVRTLSLYAGMQTYLSEYHLEAAQLALQLQEDQVLAQQHLAQAETLMQSSGYLRHQHESLRVKKELTQEQPCCA